MGVSMSRLSKKDKRRLRQEGVLDKNAEFNSKNFHPKHFEPLTEGQEAAFEAWEDGYDLMMLGCAGTGKTFLGLYFGLREIFNNNNHLRKIEIFRSAVPTRDQGFQPGTASEKLSVYTSPYPKLVNTIFGRRDAFEILKQKDMIGLNSTSFERGKEYDNSVMLLDEAQNFTFHELDTVYTRIGEDSKIVICGDTVQNDLIMGRKKEDSGLNKFISIADKMEEFDIIEFDVDDIVRSGKVKSYIKTKHELGIL
jgi:phosphate starvation-inducible protein PhoH